MNSQDEIDIDLIHDPHCHNHLDNLLDIDEDHDFDHFHLEGNDGFKGNRSPKKPAKKNKNGTSVPDYGRARRGGYDKETIAQRQRRLNHAPAPFKPKEKNCCPAHMDAWDRKVAEELKRAQKKA